MVEIMSTQPRKQYKAPVEGQPLMTVILSGCKTPILDVKFCNLIKPFFYPNSPNVPRYSITCVIDPIKHKDFLKSLQDIEREEKVDTILKNESNKEGDSHLNTGKILVKFQSKMKIATFVIEGEGKPEEIDLQDELAKGEKIYVMYDVLRYTKKNSLKTEHGLSFKPTAIYYYPK
jgi:hypothetical protein